MTAERLTLTDGDSRRHFLHGMASAAALALSACAGSTAARPARPATPEGSAEEQEAEVKT